MRRRALILALVAGVSIAGCVRTQPIYNITNAPLPRSPGAAEPTTQQVARAIYAAGKRLGWQIHEVRPGEMTGTLRLRAHVAVVSIVHDTSKFSIRYKDSTNLLHAGDVIHRNYNNWIRNLERNIHAELANLPAAR